MAIHGVDECARVTLSNMKSLNEAVKKTDKIFNN
jgi:hypothetical protein